MLVERLVIAMEQVWETPQVRGIDISLRESERGDVMRTCSYRQPASGTRPLGGLASGKLIYTRNS